MTSGTKPPFEETTMGNDQLAIVTKDLDLESATALRAAFEQMFSKAEEWIARAKDIRVSSIEQTHDMRLARESRLGLRSIRIDAEKTRKRLKADSLQRSKAIDGLYNVLEALITPIEAHLLEQEQFAERAEAKRCDALREARTATLQALGADPTAYADLGAMQADTWSSVFDQAKRADADRKEAARRAEEVRLESERIAIARREEERKAAVKAEAERVEREKTMAAENERLRVEVEAKEKAAQAERQRLEAEHAAEREKAAADREAQEMVARKAQEDAERAKRELAAEREKVARETRERDEADRARREAEQRAKARAAAAPDQEKLRALANAMRALELPSMGTTRGKQIMVGITGRLAKLATQIEEAADGMGDSTEAAQ